MATREILVSRSSAPGNAVSSDAESDLSKKHIPISRTRSDKGCERISPTTYSDIVLAARDPSRLPRPDMCLRRGLWESGLVKVGYVMIYENDRNPEPQRRGFLAAGYEGTFEVQSSAREAERPEPSAALIT